MLKTLEKQQTKTFTKYLRVRSDSTVFVVVEEAKRTRIKYRFVTHYTRVLSRILYDKHFITRDNKVAATNRRVKSLMSHLRETTRSSQGLREKKHA